MNKIRIYLHFIQSVVLHSAYILLRFRILNNTPSNKEDWLHKIRDLMRVEWEIATEIILCIYTVKVYTYVSCASRRAPAASRQRWRAALRK
jgi:hypothetical protein